MITASRDLARIRAALVAAVALVDRLADRVRGRHEDWAARGQFMSDEDLERRIVELVEKLGGPDAAFAEVGWTPDDHPSILRILREHDE